MCCGGDGTFNCESKHVFMASSTVHSANVICLNGSSPSASWARYLKRLTGRSLAVTGHIIASHTLNLHSVHVPFVRLSQG